jgi:hypothetical protein
MDYENPIKLRHDPLIWLEVERDFNHDQRIVGGCNLAINEIKSLRSSIRELQTNTKPTKETLLEYIDAFRRAGTSILVTSNLNHEQMMIARSELNKLIKRKL